MFNGLKLEDICDYSQRELNEVMKKISEVKKNIPFLQWTRVKATKTKTTKKTGQLPMKKNTSTYHSEKQSISLNSKAFVEKFQDEITTLQEHNRKKIDCAVQMNSGNQTDCFRSCQ